ncbi:hypothetical protein [Legionella shakespearei]|nr:hypothetical protein [Legionella shakespearei]
MNKKWFHTLERECLIYLSKREVTQVLLLSTPTRASTVNPGKGRTNAWI